MKNIQLTKLEAQEKLMNDFVLPILDGKWLNQWGAPHKSKTIKSVPVGLTTTVEAKIKTNKEIEDLLEIANVSSYGDTYVSFRREGKRGKFDLSFYVTIKPIGDTRTAKITVKETVKSVA